MSETVEIRSAINEDAETLAQIGWKSFYDAFADHPKNAPDDLKSYMDEAFTTKAFADDLADKNVIYFIAEISGSMVGYAKLKQNSREEGVSGENPLELCRLYSLNEFIGKGIGKTLMLQSLKFAEENAHDFMWLGVWEYNFRAQEFYKKFGFEKCGEHIFQLGRDPQTDWIFQRKI